MEYKEKLKQCERECKIALIGLALTFVIWLICGFGLSNFDIVVFSTPLWIIAGLGATFLFACVFSIFFAKCVMKDISLDEEEQVS